MRFPTAKFTEIAKTSILIILILNFFIIFFEIKYIEYIYLIIFFIFNFLVKITEIKNYKNTYEKLKEILKAKKNFFVAVNILIFFYIFKEPYFFLFKYKILILLGSIVTAYLSLIFIQKIKIRLSLNFFKEIVKIFLISAIIYYLPIVSVHLGKFFYIF